MLEGFTRGKPSVGLPISFTEFSGSYGLFLAEIDWEHIRSYKIKKERIVFQDQDILIGMDGCTYSDYSDRKNNMAQTNRVHKFSYIMQRPTDLIGSGIKFKDTDNFHIIPFVSIRREKNIYHVFQGEWKPGFNREVQLLAEDKMKIIHFDVFFAEYFSFQINF